MPPKQQAGGQGQGGGDSSLAPFWIMLTIFGLGYLAWYKGHTYIVLVVFQIKILEIALIEMFFTIPVLHLWDAFMKTVPAMDVSWSQLVAACSTVGYFIRYPFAAILVAMAAWVYMKNVGMRFRRTHSMQTLRQQEQVNWPQIMPVISKDLAAQDIKLGPWAMALTPMEFARHYNLLKKDEFAQRAPSNMEIPLTATIKKGEARRIFTLQLGAYWNGFDALPIHTKAMAAIFCARINRDRDGAARLLKTLSQSFSKGKLDTTLVLPLLNKHRNSELVQEVIQKHAYIFTVMAALLEAARDDGVLASADFLWLKPVDRRLWYILNNVGRQTAFVEVAGIFAHWQVEKALKQRSLVPMVDEAVKALEIGIKEIKLTPKEFGAIS